MGLETCMYISFPAVAFEVETKPENEDSWFATCFIISAFFDIVFVTYLNSISVLASLSRMTQHLQVVTHK